MNKIKNLIIIAFALSGMTALIYEVVWTRPLQLIFGSTIYAVSTMLTTFMFGFALGSFIFRNVADRTKNPLLLFAKLEFGIALYGFIIIFLFKLVSNIYVSMSGIPGFQFLQFILCFIVLIIPATLFGGSWPVVNKAYSDIKKLGKDTGLLYSFNSLGATLGSLAAGFLLIPSLGITKTSLLAASLNLLIAIIIFIYSREENKSGS